MARIYRTEPDGYEFVDSDELETVYTYNADGTLATETVEAFGDTHVKTYTYTNGQLTGESAWVRQ